MKIGIFGGTFDPIHRGHVETARQARAELGLDRVLFLPTARPPHRPEPDGASPWARFTMVELALLEEDGLYASAHELTPGRAAYTVETLEYFVRQGPEARLHLLLGADSLAGLPTWRRPLDIARLARLVILARPGWRIDQVRRELPAELEGALWKDGASTPPPPHVVHSSVPISATHIREALGRGEEPPAGCLDPKVLHYVWKYHLYR